MKINPLNVPSANSICNYQPLLPANSLLPVTKASSISKPNSVRLVTKTVSLVLIHPLNVCNAMKDNCLIIVLSPVWMSVLQPLIQTIKRHVISVTQNALNAKKIQKCALLVEKA